MFSLYFFFFDFDVIFSVQEERLLICNVGIDITMLLSLCSFTAYIHLVLKIYKCRKDLQKDERKKNRNKEKSRLFLSGTWMER